MRRRRRRVLLLLGLAVLPAAACAGPAAAATVTLDGTTVRVTGAPGERNALTVDVNSSRIRVSATAATATPSGFCFFSSGRATCSRYGVTGVVVDLGDGDDTLTVTGSALPVTVLDGPGNDIVTGGAGDDTLVAGTGADVLAGGAGNDTVDYSA